MRYLIHACPDRIWYVNEFLIPSMKAQGITEDEIVVWNDVDRKGNLQSFVDSCAEIGKYPGGTWHLQDDVIICKDFAERTRKYDEGIVCGFCNETFGPDVSVWGVVPMIFMWNSFQCIRIPNSIAKEFVEWFETTASQDNKYQNWIAQKKFDDSFFHDFLEERYRDDHMQNLKPNLVDHIDFLLGGSVINQWRGFYARATYWEDEDMVRKLKDEIKAR